MDDAQFGIRIPGVTYVDRPGVYAVVVRDGLLLVVETATGYFLPGGGVDECEPPLAALQRELLEEAGLQAIGLTVIGTARQYVIDAETGTGFNKIETYYHATTIIENDVPTEPDHAVRWVPIPDSLDRLYEEAQVSVVRQVVPCS